MGIIPLERIISQPHVPPHHPFLRLAILYYFSCPAPTKDNELLSTNQRQQIYLLTARALFSLGAVPPDPAIVDALLVLSYAPTRYDDKSFSNSIDPNQAALLALDMARRCGLEDSVSIVRQRTIDWGPSETTSQAFRRMCLVSYYISTGKGLYVSYRI
jgi:hypothetical protein